MAGCLPGSDWESSDVGVSVEKQLQHNDLCSNPADTYRYKKTLSHSAALEMEKCRSCGAERVLEWSNAG